MGRAHAEIQLLLPQAKRNARPCRRLARHAVSDGRPSRRAPDVHASARLEAPSTALHRRTISTYLGLHQRSLLLPRSSISTTAGTHLSMLDGTP